MSPFTKKLLMPLFRALASLGLGNPHTPYENELMLAGVKPVAIISKRDMSSDIEKAIAKNQIVIAGEKEINNSFKLLYLPHIEQEAQKAASIYSSFLNTGKISYEGNQFLNSFIGPSLSGEFNQDSLSINKLLTGKVTSLEPTPSVIIKNEYIDLYKAEEKGSINSVEFNVSRNVIVLAQYNKRSDGEEVYDRYYNDGKNSPKIENDDEYEARIGKLLGYTDNNIAWRLGTKYQNKQIHRLLSQTRDIRCKARKLCLLEKGI